MCETFSGTDSVQSWAHQTWAKWVIFFLPCFHWKQPIPAKRGSFNHPVSLCKSFSFSSIIITFFNFNINVKKNKIKKIQNKRSLPDFPSHHPYYCGFILIRGYQFSWIEEKIQFMGYVNSWITVSKNFKKKFNIRKHCVRKFVDRCPTDN